MMRNTFVSTREFVAGMVRSGRGAIVNIASVAWLMGPDNEAVNLPVDGGCLSVVIWGSYGGFRNG